jgi:hypothetical protein
MRNYVYSSWRAQGKFVNQTVAAALVQATNRHNATLEAQKPLSPTLKPESITNAGLTRATSLRRPAEVPSQRDQGPRRKGLKVGLKQYALDEVKTESKRELTCVLNKPLKQNSSQPSQETTIPKNPRGENLEKSEKAVGKKRKNILEPPSRMEHKQHPFARFDTWEEVMRENETTLRSLAGRGGRSKATTKEAESGGKH